MDWQAITSMVVVQEKDPVGGLFSSKVTSVFPVSSECKRIYAM